MACKVLLVAAALLCAFLSSAAAEESAHSLAKRFLGYHRHKVYVVNNPAPVYPVYHTVHSHPAYPAYPAYQPPSHVVVIKKPHRPGLNFNVGFGG